MDKKRIQQILEELYAVDDSLRTQEKELRVVISRLLDAQPDQKINRGFQSQLRQRLSDRINAIQSPAHVP